MNNKREVLIILNKIKNVVESDNIETKIIFNQTEATYLYKYLIELKKCHEKDVELIDNILFSIQKSRGLKNDI